MLLEPGMVIYSKGGIYCGLTRRVIDRVTEKQAVVKINDQCENRFDREVGNGRSFWARGGRVVFAVETPALKAQYFRERLIAQFATVAQFPSKLTDDQLARILAIAEEPRP